METEFKMISTENRASEIQFNDMKISSIFLGSTNTQKSSTKSTYKVTIVMNAMYSLLFSTQLIEFYTDFIFLRNLFV